MVFSGREYFLLFATSLIVVGLLTPIMRLLALKFDVVDSPGESHKTHRKPVPYLGGVAIASGVIVVSYSSVVASNNSRANLLLASSVLIPGIIIGTIGLVDDFLKLSPWPRFLAQNLVGLLSAMILISTNTLGRPTGSLVFDAIITMFWIVGLTNAINFFDNIDGGASGTVAISAFVLFLLGVQGDQYVISALSLVLCGATLGFLIWNRPPARIYMGDAGSLFLGLILASLAIRLEPNPINQFASFAVPILIVAVPILDTSVVVMKRLARNISPFQGGKDHLSHRLMRLGLSKRQAILSLWLLSAYFSSLAVVLSNSAFNLEGLITLIAGLSWGVCFIFFARLADS
jgi:UDP-GlcNAc:undecaprenyl-phosphate GlcNAc-1-phosphate transferase